MAGKMTKKVDVRKYLEEVCHLEQVSYWEFYCTIFPAGELEERHERREDYKDGRPTAQAKVMEWRQQHPDRRKIDCERETGLSRPTVLKWWNMH